jgi:hypothetical protein
VHAERAAPASALSDLLDAGAHILFQTPPSDYRSPFRELEERASRRKLDPRSFYLYREFMR